MTTDTTTGSCLCGAIKYSFAGVPATRVLCHCLDCRKISGSHYSDNALLASSQFSLLAGTPSTFTIAPSPKGPQENITSHFCAKCGSTLWRTGEGFKGYVSVRLGTLDDEEWVGKEMPDSEYFADRRVGWLPVLIEEKEKENK